MPRKLLLTDAMVMTLIKELKTNGRCIWDHEDENFNDRFSTMTAWIEIAKVVELPPDVLKAKWKNLRDLLRREARRFNVQNPDDYPGKWRHFRAMWFVYRPEDYTSNENTNDNNEDNEDNEDEIESTSDNFIKFETPDSQEVEVYLDDPIDPTPEKRRRYNDDDYDLMFLKSLTPYFRQLEPIRKLVLRSKIQDMLMNEIAAQSATNKASSRKS